MPAPYPTEAVAKGRALSQTANAIYAHYCWLARWSDEITKDPDLDLKKLAQLGLIHCRLFAELTANPPQALAVAFEDRCRREGLVWPTQRDMLNDLAALRTAALALFAYVRDNVPESRQSVRVEFAPYKDSAVEVAPAKLPKPHPVVAEVAKLRALFK